MTDREIIHTIALYKTAGIGAQRAKKLISSFGSASDVFSARNFDIIRISGIRKESLINFPDKKVLDQAENELVFIRSNNIDFIRFDSPKYPLLLKQLYDSPLFIQIKGNYNLDSNRVISIVGTRNMTNYGREFCEKLIEAVAPYKPTIVSGLAYGVDITAHKEAIKHNLQNFAIVAHGLDIVYPAIHKQYAQQIVKNGGLISEFLSGDIPDRENFPKRNRIIAGLSPCTIVIEAADKGGALITAELANDYNRDVFALPGRVGDTFSSGCNRLIQQDKAILLNSPEDIITYLNWDKPKKNTIQKSLFIETNETEDIVINTLNGKEIFLDELASKSNIPVYKLVSVLLVLELKGLVKSLPGKIYKLN